jgi:hypothetical protein
MDIIRRLRKYDEVPSQIEAMQAEIYSIRAQLRSMDESLKSISNSANVSSDSAQNRSMQPSIRRRLLAVVLIGLLCAGIAYSEYQISSAQGYIAIDQHDDQEATSLLVVSVQQGLVGHHQLSDYFYNGAMKILKLNGPLIAHYENVQADYSLPLIVSTALLGALLGWALTEMLRARRREAPPGPMALR